VKYGDTLSDRRLGITIRDLGTDEELEEFQRVIKQVWGAEDIDVPPKHLLVSARAHGGLVLGAFEEGGRMVGILFGIPALRDGKVYHYSHMCGVLPERRYQGVGYQLKLRQREFVLGQGLDLVMWTYDPLETANGHFNLSKLGAICRTYRRNFYGVMRDSLNAGLESDRFLVEWWVKSRRVVERLQGTAPSFTVGGLLRRGAARVNATEVSGGMLRPVAHDLGRSEEQLLVEVPDGIQRIKSAAPSLAREWRMVTREIFEAYFARGYVATELLRETSEGLHRCFYLIQRGYTSEGVGVGAG